MIKIQNIEFSSFFNEKIYSKTFLLRELWAFISLDVFDVYQYFLAHVIENVEFSYPKIFFQLKIFFMREIKGQSKKIAKNVPNGTFFGVRDAKGLNTADRLGSVFQYGRLTRVDTSHVVQKNSL